MATQKMSQHLPKAYTVYHTVTLRANSLRDKGEQPELVKAYDALRWCLSKMEPEDKVNCNTEQEA